MATEAELKKLIKKQNGGAWIDYDGPWKLGTTDIYEMWTTTQDDPYTVWWADDGTGQPVKVTPQQRFLVEEEDGSNHYFDHFANLVPYLHKRILSAARHGADVDLAIQRQAEEFKLKRVTLYVASVVFVAAVGSMIWLIVGGKGTPWLALIAVAGLISSGAVLFFGVWRPITIPKGISLGSGNPPVQP